ncbi:MAG: hypothetical protein Q9195_006990 [Heterodermia aff. obscurata]
MDRSGVFDDLEPDRQVVDHSQHQAADAQREPDRGGYASLLDDARRHCSHVAFPYLYCDEGARTDPKDDEQCDDPPIVPSVGRASPLQGEQQRYHSRKEEDSANGIQLNDLFLDGFLRLLLRQLQNKCHNRQSYCSDRKVDIETPAPGDLTERHQHSHHQTPLLGVSMLTCCVNAPPSNGPATDAIPNTDPKIPWYTGLFANGIIFTIMIIAPFIMPAAPNPDTARPTMKALDVGAAPQSTEPISKMTIMLKKTHLGE